MAKFEKDRLAEYAERAYLARNLQRIMVGATALAIPGALIADWVSVHLTGQPTGLKEMAVDFATTHPKESVAIGAGALATYAGVGVIKRANMKGVHGTIVEEFSSGWNAELKDMNVPRFPNIWNPWQKS